MVAAVSEGDRDSPQGLPKVWGVVNTMSSPRCTSCMTMRSLAPSPTPQRCAGYRRLRLAVAYLVRRPVQSLSTVAVTTLWERFEPRSASAGPKTSRAGRCGLAPGGDGDSDTTSGRSTRPVRLRPARDKLLAQRGCVLHSKPWRRLAGDWRALAGERQAAARERGGRRQ